MTYFELQIVIDTENTHTYIYKITRKVTRGLIATERSLPGNQPRLLNCTVY